MNIPPRLLLYHMYMYFFILNKTTLPLSFLCYDMAFIRVGAFSSL